MKNFIITIILILMTGCVQSEVAGGPSKMKTTTVWNSDLRLNYDGIYKRDRNRQNEPYDYEDYFDDYEIEEVAVTLEILETPEEIEKILEIEEVSNEDINKIMKEQISKKIIEDELKTKKIESIEKLENLNVEEEKDTRKTRWFIALVAFTTLGGFFNSSMKKNRKKEE